MPSSKENETRTLETPDEKKQRRQEKKEKKENEKSTKEIALSETPEEKKKRRKESKEKKKQKKAEKKEKKEKESRTLSAQLKTANETIRQLDERNARMSDLEVQFVKTQEHLEYMTEENNEYSSRVRALEQALILQETELDNALAFIRQNDQAKQGRDLIDAEKATNPFASEEGNRNDLKAVLEELGQLKQERDMAVEKATMVSIQLAELKAETDESRDQLTESHAVIEQMRTLCQKGGSPPSSTGAIKRGFFWKNKKDEKSDMSPNDDEGLDTTEGNTSVSSAEWTQWDEMDYHERRHAETP
jgi:hypothetical protein